MPDVKKLETALPVAPLKLIAMQSAKNLGSKVNDYLVEYRRNIYHSLKNDPAFQGYTESSYLCSVECLRFGTGEGKAVFHESIRGKDLYILVDVCNHDIPYQVNGYLNHMSPDDHYQDLKRVIAAVSGKAHRINVIMPFLYESRQHKRAGRESLDCAIALEELYAMGVSNVITFDAHDFCVQNAVPLAGFDNFTAHYQFMQALLKNVPDLLIDKKHTIVISPDEGAVSRAVYFAGVLGVDTGMFYKRRDYTRVVNGRNPIVAHEFLGSSVEGKDMIIIDDMISSGESAIEVARALKARKANRIFICATFGLFTGGLERFDEAYKEGIISKVLTTNLIYQTPELLSREWYINCDMSKYIAYLIDTLNHDSSISDLLNPNEKIQNVVAKYKEGKL